MKKFAKRSYSEREKTFALAGCVCQCGCPCSGLVCDCPITPTHQIGLNQASQRKETASVGQDASTAAGDVISEKRE